MRIGALFAGYGGLEMGVQAVVGGTVAWHVEYDAAPSKILAHHWPDVPNHGDVKTTDWTTVEPVDVLTAGYPCQPFSHAGNRKGADDPRHLWPDVLRAIRVLRPRLVLLENVAGHLSLGFDVVLGDLAEAGFDAEWVVLPASRVGAPHGRARLFIAATPTDRAGDTRRVAHRDGGAATDAIGGELQRRRNAGELGGSTGTTEGARDQRERDGNAADRRGAAVTNPPRVGRGEGRPELARRSGRPAAVVGGCWYCGWPLGTGPDCDNCGGTIRHQVAPDTDDLRHEQAGGTRRRRGGPADGSVPVADTTGEGLEGRRAERSGTSSPLAPDRGPAADADQPSGEARGRRQGPGDAGRLQPVVGGDTHWGTYAPAVHRWEAAIGRPAPRPVEPSPRGGRDRLSPAFVEWMMGLPEGHVTAVPGLSRNDQLKALGNGVVPQQAAAAYAMLLPALLDGRWAA